MPHPKCPPSRHLNSPSTQIYMERLLCRGKRMIHTKFVTRYYGEQNGKCINKFY